MNAKQEAHQIEVAEEVFGYRQCFHCGHYDAAKGNVCKAFPNGIPLQILDQEHDHKLPYPGDNGIRFEPK